MVPCECTCRSVIELFTQPVMSVKMTLYLIISAGDLRLGFLLGKQTRRFILPQAQKYLALY